MVGKEDSFTNLLCSHRVLMENACREGLIRQAFGDGFGFEGMDGTGSESDIDVFRFFESIFGIRL